MHYIFYIILFYKNKLQYRYIDVFKKIPKNIKISGSGDGGLGDNRLRGLALGWNSRKKWVYKKSGFEWAKTIKLVHKKIDDAF